jgi:uncharacterized protein (TIGR00369 family)
MREDQTTDLNALVAAIPIARFFGLQLRLDDTQALIAKLPFRQMLIGNPTVPAIHGGALGVLLEWVALFEVLRRDPTAPLPKTITATIDYLRPAFPRDLEATVTLTRLGRRVATLHAQAWQDERTRLVATGKVQLLVQPSSGPGARAPST